MTDISFKRFKEAHKEMMEIKYYPPKEETFLYQPKEETFMYVCAEVYTVAMREGDMFKDENGVIRLSRPESCPGATAETEVVVSGAI